MKFGYTKTRFFWNQSRWDFSFTKTVLSLCKPTWKLVVSKEN